MKTAKQNSASHASYLPGGYYRKLKTCKTEVKRFTFKCA